MSRVPSKRLAALVRHIAHRGLHDRAAGVIENSATAFEAAIAGGYGIECDLQRDRFGEPVVFHDATLGRLTDAVGRVADHSAAELGRLRLKGTKDRILPLADFLDLVGGRAPILIEIKSDWSEASDFPLHIARRLKSYTGAYGVMSFDPRRVAPLRKDLPGIPLGIVAGGMRKESPAPAWLRRWRARDLFDNPIITPDFVAYFVKGLPTAAAALSKRPASMPLFTWTVRTPADRAKAGRHADAMIFEGFRPTEDV